MADLAAELPLLSTSYPIALFPVRVETRFATGTNPRLLVRVYPDELVADAHRRPLSSDEWRAAQTYWQTAWNPTAELDAWRGLVAQFAPPRAAWLVARGAPTNVAVQPRPAAPTFVAPELRDDVLAEVVARLLPRAWMAIGYRGGVEVARVTGADIVTPLRLSFRPDLAADASSLAHRDELTIDRELLWTVDFDAAAAAGMALTIPLRPIDLDAGFDRLLVLGVRTGVPPGDAAAELAALFDAHHYTRGLALVRQGTPTNNSALAPSGYPPPGDAVQSFAIERASGHAGLVVGTDADALTRALGLPATAAPPLARIDGARRTEQAAAAAMLHALWPCTLGYFLEQMMTPLLDTAQIDAVQGHVLEYVRGRGPLPAMRVGHVPYGILPATSLGRWQGAATAIDTGLVRLLNVWRARFLARASAVPRVGQTGDADHDLLGVLSRDALSRELRSREVVGPGYVQNLWRLIGLDPAVEATARATLASAALAEAGLTGSHPRVTRMTFSDKAARIGRPLVTGAPLTEEGELTPNYIRELRTASTASLRDAGLAGHPAFGNPVLYHLLRQASLIVYARLGLELAIRTGVAQPIERLEHELHKIAPGTEARLTTWERLSRPLAGLTGTKSLGEWLLAPSTDGDRAKVRTYRANLQVLEKVPPAELERLLRETLDVSSHRLDAWITSMATRRLAAMRKTAPAGIHVGAYGWVENLRRRTTPRGGTAGGFIHAPSAAHAAAAAVLRNAHLTRTGAARAEVAVDLSSQRVRRARELLDGVRQGLPLGAVLGYRFERAVHDTGLDMFIAPFRAHFPLGRDPAVLDEPTDRIAARNVVDGVALRTALAGSTTAATIPWAALPPVATVHRDRLAVCLLALDADLDSAADLLLAESIYQTVRGNTERASATLASLAGEGDVPDPQVAAMPRGGIAGTHRVAILLGSGTFPPTWPSLTPRRVAEPRLGAWLGEVLGDPQRVRARVSFPDPAGGGARRSVTVTLAELALSPFDVVAMARATDLDGRGELAARLAQVVATRDRGRRGLEIDHRRDPAAPRDVTFLELLEVARLIGESVDAARPLVASDLVIPGDEPPPETPQEALAARLLDARERLVVTRGLLVQARTEASAPAAPVSLDVLRSQLWAAVGFGLRAATPASTDDADPATRPALLAQAEAAHAELQRRLNAADVATAPREALRAMFGDTVPILSPFLPGNRAAIDAAIAHGPTLVGDPYAPRRWFEGAARVRPPLAALRLATMASEAIGGGRFELQIGQLPHAPGTRWFGGRFHPKDGKAPPPAGALSLAVTRHLTFTPGGGWAGLLLDEWAELIPSAIQDTSFAVHHDAPGAEAPQCVLLAVPPVLGGGWNLPSLVDILHETLDLAKIRAVDAEHLGVLGMFAPTTYLAANLANDTITLDLAGQTINEISVLASE